MQSSFENFLFTSIFEIISDVDITVTSTIKMSTSSSFTRILISLYIYSFVTQEVSLVYLNLVLNLVFEI